MTGPTQPLTVDEAMAEFQAVTREVLGDTPSYAGSMPSTPEEAEEGRFRFAEFILGLACPDPRACTDPRCRRNGLCRHFAHLRHGQQSGVPRHPRRTPGAEAVRYAVWVYMNSGK
jgi:hypothetical protein